MAVRRTVAAALLGTLVLVGVAQALPGTPITQAPQPEFIQGPEPDPVLLLAPTGPGAGSGHADGSHDHGSHDHGAPAIQPLTPAAPGADLQALSARHGHIVVDFAPPPRNVYAGPGGTADMEFRCPEGNSVLGLPLPSATGDDPVVHGCPIRVYDTGYSFGNPAVSVLDEDHTQAAFFSLHGAPSQGGPKDTSRTGLTHVTFTTDDQGLSWQDQPTDFPEGGGGFGDFASGAIDSNGNLYAAFLWNFPRGQSQFDSTIGLYKGPTTREFGGMVDSYDFGAYVDGREPGNLITAAHMIRLPSFVPIKDEAAGNGSVEAPTTDEQNGEVAGADLANATDERIVVVWHETAADYRNATTGKSAWIDAAWTDTGPQNRWTRLNKTETIGPCRDASNPAYYRDKVYVLCVVDRGYDDRPRARVGHVDMWEIDPFGGNTTLMGSTDLFGGHPMLAMNEEGYSVALVYNHDERDDGTLEDLDVRVAFSWYGRNWERIGADLGPQLRRIGGGDDLPILDAHVTALTITTDEPTALMVYKEWHDDPQEITGMDPEDPAAIIGNRLTDYNKYVYSFNSCDFPIAGAQMELGTAVDSNNADAYGQNPAVFNDIQDGLYTTREPNGEELTYFAINDYGAMQFGAIVVASTSNVCFIPPPPPFIPPVPIPQALTITTPFSAAVGAAVALPAAAMVAYLLTTKKRAASYVAAEDN